MPKNTTGEHHMSGLGPPPRTGPVCHPTTEPGIDIEERI